MESPYPIVTVEGSPYECGRQHGEAAKGLVQANISYYLGYWERNLGLTVKDVHARAESLAETVKGFDPTLMEEMRGVADGADAALEDVLAINGRYELAWASPRQLMGGCTSIGATPTATRLGCTLMAQNWDYRLGVKDSLIVLEVKRDGSPAVAVHTEAGVIGHKGMNSAGLGLLLNAMVSGRDRLGDSVPFLLVCRKMLNCDRLSDAVNVFINAGRAVSYNMMVGCEGALLDLEAYPGGVSTLMPEGGVLVHTNHFVGPRPLEVSDEYVKAESSTLHRYAVAREQMARGAGGHRVESLMEVLRNHVDYPTSVCYHVDTRKDPDQREETLSSVVMNLEERAMWLTRGPPCGVPYMRLSLPSLLDTS